MRDNEFEAVGCSANILGALKGDYGTEMWMKGDLLMMGYPSQRGLMVATIDLKWLSMVEVIPFYQSKEAMGMISMKDLARMMVDSGWMPVSSKDLPAGLVSSLENMIKNGGKNGNSKSP